MESEKKSIFLGMSRHRVTWGPEPAMPLLVTATGVICRSLYYVIRYYGSLYSISSVAHSIRSSGWRQTGTSDVHESENLLESFTWGLVPL